MRYGFVKVASAVPAVRVGNCAFNTQHIIDLIKKAEDAGAEIICFPELCITGYTCQDLFESSLLIDDAEKSLAKIVEETRQLNIISIVGLPIVIDGYLANCAAVVQKGVVLGIVPKTFLPNYKEFYEKRWFASSDELRSRQINCCGQNVAVSADALFRTPDAVFGIEICEDLWAPISRSSHLTLAGADIIFNLSADNECVGKHDYVEALVSGQSARTISGYIFTSCGFGESTQDVVFAGCSLIYENGRLLNSGKRFSLDEQLVASEIDVELLRHERRVNTTFRHCARINVSDNKFVWIDAANVANQNENLTRHIEPLPFVPANTDYHNRCEEIVNIQANGLAKRLAHIHAKNVVVGISGGLDSTLALLVCVRAFDRLNLDRKGIVGVTMPGFGTSVHTHTNATDLMEELNISVREISIKDACIQHFKDIGHDLQTYDITYENGQARERTKILMDVANQVGGIVVGTGDLSELALGWATYNGDHMSMYGVNCSIPKTLIRHLIQWFADNTPNKDVKRTLESIIATPISPELIPTNEKGEIVQKTEDKVGPYELHDFFLFYTLRYGFSPAKIYFLARKAFALNNLYNDEVIKHWLKVFFHRFFQQQFKRSCLPDGPKVGSCSLSPRGDWRMPSDGDGCAWKEECDKL